MSITPENIKSILSYDKETGIFTWRIKPRLAMSIGDIAGGTNHKGYRKIRYLHKLYREHHLAWLYVYGVWPKEIDHINGIRSDNRIANLRSVTRRENEQNRIEHRQGKLPGSCFDKRRNGWRAQITINGKSIHIGMFSTEQEASKAYFQAVANLSKNTEEVRV